MANDFDFNKEFKTQYIGPQYYEDFTIGDEYTTASRTITEADIVNFAGLSGDWADGHVSKEAAKKFIWGDKRIAHGMLVASILSGLISQMGFYQEGGRGFVGANFKIPKPTFIGDTITIKIKVVDKRESKKGGRGIVTFERKAVNQRGETVLEGQWILMMAMREKEAKSED